jgi:hypothetical protein
VNWKGFGWKRSWPDSRYCPIICLEGWMKTTKSSSQHSRYPGRDPNQYLTNTSLEMYRSDNHPVVANLIHFYQIHFNLSSAFASIPRQQIQIDSHVGLLHALVQPGSNELSDVPYLRRYLNSLHQTFKSSCVPHCLVLESTGCFTITKYNVQ